MVDNRKKILIIDDDKEVCEFVEDLLSFRFHILKAYDADSGLKTVHDSKPDLVILDLKLQNQNGLDICRVLRESPGTKQIPILVYSGSDDLENVTTAFDLGADDYVFKTARPRELVARILSKIRRIEEREEDPELIACGNLSLNTRKLEATINERPLPLSVLEFNLLRFFVTNKDRVMSRQQILEGVWKDAVVSNRTIDTHMVYLRKKLIGFDHVLATVYGAGYILRDSPSPNWQPSAADDETP
jgi:DNA-binding response OmpR family regulator